MYIGVSLVDNKTMRALNKKYLGRDCPTDVLSFNYLDDGVGEASYRGSKDYLGDVVVSVEKAREQASENQNTYEQEVADLVAHGVLHLLGVHHEGDDHEDFGRPRKPRRKV